jgi:hypothetical protein
LIQPAGQHGARRQFARLARQNDEDRLRDFLGVMRIAGETQRGGIDEVHIPRDEGGKGGLGFGAGEFGEQFVVVQFRHLPNDVREPQNWTNYFAFSTTSIPMGIFQTEVINEGLLQPLLIGLILHV